MLPYSDANATEESVAAPASGIKVAEIETSGMVNLWSVFRARRVLTWPK
jgi:hypothetical protein